MQPIRLILIDDHKLIREAWSCVLNNDSRFTVVGESGNAEEGIELCKRYRPDIVLLDINLPGMNGLEAVPQIRKFAPATKILGVSLYTQVIYARRMVKKGASGYITKNSSREEMVRALLEIDKGATYICQQIRNILTDNMVREESGTGDFNTLTMREIEVINYIRKGFSTKEIAVTASISTKTVEVHRYNIFKKLNIKNAAALMEYVHHHDFLEE